MTKSLNLTISEAFAIAMYYRSKVFKQPIPKHILDKAKSVTKNRNITEKEMEQIYSIFTQPYTDLRKYFKE